MSKTPSAVWSNCLSFIKDNIQPQAYKTWFEPITPVKLTERQKKILEELELMNQADRSKHSPRSKTWLDEVKDFFE